MMQTFLSEPTFQESVAVLSTKHIVKQLFECKQILEAINKTPEGGTQRIDGKPVFAANHPVTNMFRGYERYLFGYAEATREENVHRNYKTENHWAAITTIMNELNFNELGGLNELDETLPGWATGWQRERIQLTHRANLYAKDPIWYAQYEQDHHNLHRVVLDVVCCPDKVRKGTHQPYFYPTHYWANQKP